MRHQISIARVWRPLFAAMGGRRSRSYIEVGDDSVRLRFGSLFDQTVPREQIAGASRTTWPFLGGYGWRIAGRGTVGLIGERQGVVEIRLEQERRVRVAGIRVRCRRIVVSVEDPPALLADLERPVSAAGP